MSPTTEGTIFSINASPGGVPKLPVADSMVTVMGLDRDRHTNLKYHGGPERAVCIFAIERIRALREEGHPIGTGTTGENLTLSGIDWELVVPGAMLEAGDCVMEILSYTTPCRTIRKSFVGEKFTRLSQKHFPGWSRVYARVIREGLVRTGERVALTGGGHSRYR